MIELLVGVQLAVIVTALALGLYLVATKAVHRWQANLRLQNALHLTLTRLADDAHRAERITWIGANGWAGALPGGRAVVYRLNADTLLRNTRRMHRPPLTVAAFTVHASKFDPAYLEFDLTLSDGFRRMRATTGTLRRPAASWPEARPDRAVRLRLGEHLPARPILRLTDRRPVRSRRAPGRRRNRAPYTTSLP